MNIPDKWEEPVAMPYKDHVSKINYLNIHHKLVLMKAEIDENMECFVLKFMMSNWFWFSFNFIF